MPTPQKRQSKSSNKSIKAQDQVVDVSPLNSTEQPKTSSKVKSSLNENSSNTLKTSTSKKLSNTFGGGGSSKSSIDKNKDFPNNSTKHLGLSLVNGCNLSPFPAAKIIAFKTNFPKIFYS